MLPRDLRAGVASGGRMPWGLPRVAASTYAWPQVNVELLLPTEDAPLFP